MDKNPVQWAARISSVGAAGAFIGWSILTYLANFQFSVFPEGSIEPLFGAIWALGFLTLLFVILAIGVLAWRKS